MKKISVILTFIIITAIFSLSFTACGGNSGGENNPEHEHTYSEEWSSDENYHWHEATCEHTEMQSERAPHTYESGFCTVCGCEEPSQPEHEHTYSEEWSSDENYHWHEATCEHTEMQSEKAPHTYESGVCTVCGCEEPSQPGDDGAEMKKEGWLYYEDFSLREKVPSYLYNATEGLGRAVIEDGALRMTVVGGGNRGRAFFNYEFSRPLSGIIAVEAKVRADSLAFINTLFFFKTGTEDFLATSNVVTNLVQQSGVFKNNSGSGWTGLSVPYETGRYYDIKMVLDTEKECYWLTVDGESRGNIPFRSKGAEIGFLRFGSETEWADVSYSFIGVREAVADDIPVADYSDYTNEFDGTAKPDDIDCSVTAGGSADFSADGSVTVSTPSSGTVSVSKLFNEAFSGVFAAEVKFGNLSSAQGTFANVLFLRNSAIEGTGGNIITFAVESGLLRYHDGQKWKTVEYNGSTIKLIDGAQYTLKAVCDCDTKKTQLYISGEKYIDGDNAEKTLGNDVFLGEYDFRNKTAGNPDTLEVAIGTGKAGTAFSVDYIKVYAVI